MRGRQRGAQGWHSGGRRPRHHDRRRAQRRQRQSPSPVVERIVRRRRTGTRQRGQRGDRLHRRRHGQIDATQQHGTTPSRAWPAAHRREDPATPRQWCVRQVQLQYKSERDKSRKEARSCFAAAPRHDRRCRLPFSIGSPTTIVSVFRRDRSLATFHQQIRIATSTFRSFPRQPSPPVSRISRDSARSASPPLFFFIARSSKVPS